MRRMTPAPDPPTGPDDPGRRDDGGIRFVGSYESPVRTSAPPSATLSPDQHPTLGTTGDASSFASVPVAASGSGSPTRADHLDPNLLPPSDPADSPAAHAPAPAASWDPPPPPSISISSSPSIEFSASLPGTAARRPSLSSSVGSTSSSASASNPGKRRGRFNPLGAKSAVPGDVEHATRGAADDSDSAAPPRSVAGSPSSSRFSLKAKRSRSGGSDHAELGVLQSVNLFRSVDDASSAPSSNSRRSSSSTTTSRSSLNRNLGSAVAVPPAGSQPPPPSSTTGEGRLARGLRKTRSGLKLFAAARAAAKEREDEPTSLATGSGVDRRGGSPPEARTSRVGPSHAGYDSRSSSSTLSLPLPDASSAAAPRSTSVQSPPVGNRVGGWFSSLRPNTDGAGTASPERSRDAADPAATGSPNRRGSPLKKSSAPATSPSGPLGRLGPFDRILDRAVQYFLDADAHADRCEDDIWLLGVRHDGWNADAVDEDAVAEDRRGGIAGLVARRTSPVKAGSSVPDDPFVVPARSGSSPAATRIHGWPATFYRDFYSRVALTYRSDFPLIECDPSPPPASGGVVQGMLSNLGMSIGRGSPVGSASAEEATLRSHGLSSDTGWGCMLRTGQSLLANALVKVHLGRGEFSARSGSRYASLTVGNSHSADWRRPLPGSSAPLADAATYARVLSLFLDDPSPPFSVHRFARQGKQLGKHVGEWFGPSTAAGAIKALVNAYDPAGLRVVSCVDGTVYESEVVEASTVDGAAWTRPVLVLVNVRLGLEGVNPVYYDSIKVRTHRSGCCESYSRLCPAEVDCSFLQSVFRFPQSVGIAGGRPMSSYYFVGAQADALFYIDPHFTRSAVPVVLPSDPELVDAGAREPLSNPSSLDRFLLDAYPDTVWATYHCDKVRKVALSSLDPSMLIGFVVESASDWVDFCTRVQQVRGSRWRPVWRALTRVHVSDLVGSHVCHRAISACLAPSVRLVNPARVAARGLVRRQR